MCSKEDTFIIADTGRLCIRQLRVQDLDALYDIYNSWESLPGIYPLSSDKDEEYVKLRSYIQCMYGFYGVGLWAVCLRENGRMIGHCGAWPSEIGDDWLLELGYVIHRGFIRKGYGFECMKAIVDYIREETEFTKAAAQIASHNKASRRIAEKLGMYLEREESDLCLYMLDY